MNILYQIKNDVILRIDSDKEAFLFSSPPDSTLYELDSDYIQILKLLLSEKIISYDNLIKKISIQFPIEEIDAILNNLVKGNVIRKIEDYQYIRPSDFSESFRTYPKILNTVKSNKYIVGGPLIINWSPIPRSKCTLKCRHCYTRLETNRQELNHINILKLIDKIKHTRTLWVNIGGVEPLMLGVKKLTEYIKRLVENNIGCSIITNGYSITPDIAGELVSAGLRDVTVSIDHSKRDSHNEFRGGNTNSFDNAINAINYFKKLNIHVTLQPTITKLNYNNIPSLIELAQDLDVNSITFNQVKPFGIAKKYYDNLNLNSYQWKIASELLIDLRKKFPNIEISSHDPMLNLNQDYINNTEYFNGCSCTKYHLHLSYDGNIENCPFAQFPITTAGNLLNITSEDDFLSLWHNSFAFNLYRNIQENPKEQCTDCELFSSCRGGCPTIKLNMSNIDLLHSIKDSQQMFKFVSILSGPESNCYRKEVI